MFTTPWGHPASMISSPSRSAVSGVCSAGFNTTVQPTASAGPSFHAAISSGKFQGIICPATPTGSGQLYVQKLIVRRAGDRNRIAFDLGRPSGHVAEKLSGQRNIRDARDLQRLAVIERFELCQLLAILLDQVANLPNNPAAL